MVSRVAFFRAAAQKQRSRATPSLFDLPCLVRSSPLVYFACVFLCVAAGRRRFVPFRSVPLRNASQHNAAKSAARARTRRVPAARRARRARAASSPTRPPSTTQAPTSAPTAQQVSGFSSCERALVPSLVLFSLILTGSVRIPICMCLCPYPSASSRAARRPVPGHRRRNELQDLFHRNGTCSRSCTHPLTLCLARSQHIPALTLGLFSCLRACAACRAVLRLAGRRLLRPVRRRPLLGSTRCAAHPAFRVSHPAPPRRIASRRIAVLWRWQNHSLYLARFFLTF